MSDEWQDLIDREKYVTVEGIETHYYDEGTGDALLLLHGGGLTSCAELNWGAVIDPLSDGCRVIAPDQPGFGFTEPRGEEDFQPQKRADFVASFLDELGINSVTVAGNSRAGYQAVYLALEYPDLVEKLIIVNAGSASRKLTSEEVPGSLESDEPTREGARTFLEDFRDNHLVSPENHPLFNEGISDDAVDRVYEIQRRNCEWTNRRSQELQTSAEALNDALSYEGRHITEAATDITQRTLITWSTRPYEGWPAQKDEQTDDPSKKLVEVRPETLDSYERDEGFDMGIHLFETMATAEIHIWHDADHHVMTDQAPRWVDVVADFVTA
jgi:pimeloyl-ACP methyl ester carboxylesterase